MAKVVIYSTPTCPYCHLLKTYLQEHNIDFEDKNVAADKTAAQVMVEKSGQMGVPVAVINTDDGREEVIVGFDKDRINELLKIQS